MDWFDNYGYGYGYDGSGGLPGGMDFWAILIGFILIFVLIGLALQLALYILRSTGLYRLASNRGMSGAGLAWIPFIGFYRIGSIADDISARNGTRSHYRYILLVGGIFNFILSSVRNKMLYPTVSGFFNGLSGFGYFGRGRRYSMFSSISALTFIVWLTVFVVTMIALNKIYRCYRPASSTLWTVLSAIFPFMPAIFLFTIRNAVPVIEWGAGVYYPAQNQDWQATPQYPPYGSPPPADDRYFQPEYGQGQPPRYMPPDAPCQPLETAPVDDPYQPPAAPNPPQPWELNDMPPPPPQAPWEKDDGEHFQ